MTYKIAIDGPAGSGKSTVSKIIASQYNLTFVSTGYFFRAYALILKNNNKINATADEQLEILNNTTIDIDNDKLFINGIDSTNNIKNSEISELASMLATKKHIREIAKNSQIEIANKKDVIMDGRDIGTVIMPNANVKIYLVASIKERAKRRTKELKQLNEKTSYFKVWFEIFKRDWNDKHRKIAPLKKANDAIVVKTNNKSINDVVTEIAKYIKN
ncbi:(d)CMP kinase [Malacoplasma iowae]|uniref:(d)CMP kinase n=1 Tax=Malacoplasma iowae TaxID=2116 RepID=UPI003873611B|nr:(d)CMP kinase [Malacoplasma iowae]